MGRITFNELHGRAVRHRSRMRKGYRVVSVIQHWPFCVRAAVTSDGTLVSRPAQANIPAVLRHLCCGIPACPLEMRNEMACLAAKKLAAFAGVLCFALDRGRKFRLARLGILCRNIEFPLCILFAQHIQLVPPALATTAMHNADQIAWGRLATHIVAADENDLVVGFCPGSLLRTLASHMGYDVRFQVRICMTAVDAKQK